MPVSNMPIPVPGSYPMATFGNPEPIQGTLFPSAVYTLGNSPYNTADMFNPTHHGITLFINISNVGAAGVVTIAVQEKDPVSGSYVSISLPSMPAMAANGAFVIVISPGILETTTEGEYSITLSDIWRLQMTISGNSVTCSVGGVYTI